MCRRVFIMKPVWKIAPLLEQLWERYIFTKKLLCLGIIIMYYVFFSCIVDIIMLERIIYNGYKLGFCNCIHL